MAPVDARSRSQWYAAASVAVLGATIAILPDIGGRLGRAMLALVLGGAAGWLLVHVVQAPARRAAAQIRARCAQQDADVSGDPLDDLTRTTGELCDEVDWLRERNRWHEAVLDAIPFPLSITDREMHWTFINTAMQTIAGAERDSVIGRPCEELNAPICRTPGCGVMTLRAGKPRTGFASGGEHFQVDTTAVVVGGELVGHIETIQDVTGLTAVVDEVSTVMGRVADGDLTARINGLYKDQQAAVKVAVRHLVGGLEDGTDETVRAVSDIVAAIDNEVVAVSARTRRVCCKMSPANSVNSSRASTFAELIGLIRFIGLRAASPRSTGSRNPPTLPGCAAHPAR
jgi:PAS domain-containing protein